LERWDWVIRTGLVWLRQGNNKNNEGQQRKKHKWKHAECDHLKKKGRKKQ
jgi:hypothetical protein